MNTSFELIAKFVNTHDGGVPFLRATVTPEGVKIRSITFDVHTGETSTETDTVTTMTEARAVLGY